MTPGFRARLTRKIQSSISSGDLLGQALLEAEPDQVAPGEPEQPRRADADGQQAAAGRPRTPLMAKIEPPSSTRQRWRLRPGSPSSPGSVKKTSTCPPMTHQTDSGSSSGKGRLAGRSPRAG